MRIDEIKNLNTVCTGCAACIDVCPTNAIGFLDSACLFLHPQVILDKCINCGACCKVCPLQTQKKSSNCQHLFSAIAKDDTKRNSGSSGGVFGVLANYCLENNYYICGAAFDGMVLKHTIVKCKEDLGKLLKSKYIQSNTVGVYKKIQKLLQDGNKVLFCGTPCQVSALKNFVSQENTERLLTVDIICHGVPSQKLFDLYVEQLERKHGGTVQHFNFRVKDNKYHHAHGFRYVVKDRTKEKTVDGVYTQSSFYNAFKKYTIFQEGCYQCRYATLERTSDLTLGDFWGIEKYQKNRNTDKGVSMVIANTPKGKNAVAAITNDLLLVEFPLEYAVKSNHCLTNNTVRPQIRDAVFDDLSQYGYEYIAKKYFSSTLKQKLYWLIPPFARNILRIIRRN